MTPYEILPHHDSDERVALIRSQKKLSDLRRNREADTYELPWKNCFAKLQTFAAKGGLTFAGKRLAPDFFGRVSLSYQVEQKEEQHQVRVVVATGSRRFFLDECSWVSPGPPLLLIYGITLKVTDQLIPRPWLWDLAATPLLLTEEKFAQFAKSCVDPTDPDMPQVEGLLPNKEVESDPFPLLSLRDRAGATAQLLFEVNGTRYAYGSLDFPETLQEQARYWEKDLLESDYQKKGAAKGEYYCPIDRVGKSIG